MNAATLVESGAKTPKQICAHFGVSRTWLFQQLKDGRLSRICLSRRKTLIPVSEVADLLSAIAEKGGE
jgi:predicted site-specific integrase-resolvase